MKIIPLNINVQKNILSHYLIERGLVKMKSENLHFDAKMHKWHKCKLIQEFRCHFMVPIGLMLNYKTIKLCINEGFEDPSDKILTMNKFYQC